MEPQGTCGEEQIPALLNYVSCKHVLAPVSFGQAQTCLLVLRCKFSSHPPYIMARASCSAPAPHPGGCHLVHLPLQSIFDVQLAEQVHHVRIRAKENVQPGFNPIPIFVFPRGNFTTQHVSRFQNDRFVTGFGEVLAARQAGQSAADDDNFFLLFRRRFQIRLLLLRRR